MVEYLAPGVYVEEIDFRSKSIEGVATSARGFVGSLRKSAESAVRISAIFTIGVAIGVLASLAVGRMRRRCRQRDLTT